MAVRVKESAHIPGHITSSECNQVDLAHTETSFASETKESGLSASYSENFACPKCFDEVRGEEECE